MKLPIRHALLALAFVAGVLISDATAGSGFGAAQGVGGGASGTSLTGLGTDNALTRWDGTDTVQGSDATLSDAELLDLTDTGGAIGAFFCVGTGQTTSDVRLEVNGGVLSVREGDDSANGPMEALSLLASSHLVLVSADTSGIRLGVASGTGFVLEGDNSTTAPWGADNLVLGTGVTSADWRIDSTSSTVLTIWEGDGTDPSANESVNFGTTTGWPAVVFSTNDKANPTYSFVGDLNTGLLRTAADTLALSTGGVQNFLLSSTQISTGLDGTASPFAASIFAASTNQHTVGLLRTSADTTGATISTLKTRGAIGSYSDISTGDTIFTLHAQARIASQTEEWGRIECSTDGTIGSADRPSKWSFYTVPDGSNTLAEVFRIDQAGDVRVYGGDVFLATLDASGWKLETSASRVSLLEGDGTALTAGDELALGSTTGDPMLRSNPGATNGGFTFVGDNNTGMYRVGADDLGFATGGTIRLGLTSAGVRATDGFLILGAASNTGMRIEGNSSQLNFTNGDGSDLEDGNIIQFGTTAGRPLIQADNDGSASLPNYAFSSDGNTGVGRVEADAPAIAAEGQWRTIVSNSTTLPDNTATTIVTIPLASGAQVAGSFRLFLTATDGTDHQAFAGAWNFAAVDKAGTLSSQITTEATTERANANSGTVVWTTVTGTITDGTNAISIQIQADSTATSPTITCRWVLEMSHSTAGVAVTIP